MHLFCFFIIWMELDEIMVKHLFCSYVFGIDPKCFWNWCSGNIETSSLPLLNTTIFKGGLVLDISLIVAKGFTSRYAITTNMVLSPRLDVHISTKELNPLLKGIQQRFADAVTDSFGHDFLALKICPISLLPCSQKGSSTDTKEVSEAAGVRSSSGVHI